MLIQGIIESIEKDYFVFNPTKPLNLRQVRFMPYLPQGRVKIKYGVYGREAKRRGTSLDTLITGMDIILDVLVTFNYSFSSITLSVQG
jgi:hypothetical protein